MTSRDWVAVVDKASYGTIAADPRLPPLLALARITNSLSLPLTAVRRPATWQSPRIRRERTSAILFAGATLHEGLQVAQALGKHFPELPQYKSGFATLQADPDVQDLRRRFLKPLRDKGVFHVDAAALDSVLKRWQPNGMVVFASGRGQKAGAIYFDLADDLMIHYLFGEQKDDASFNRALTDFMTRTARLNTRFLEAAHRLLPVALIQLGVKRGRIRQPRQGSLRVAP